LRRKGFEKERKTMMKKALPILFLLTSCMWGQKVLDDPPTYKGLVCTGWTKPEAQAIADGESSGEQLVVNTPLTEREKKELYEARQEEEVAMRKESAIENSILSHHHLLFPLVEGSEWLRQGPCGEAPMIRFDEYHITEFVPSNPKYPGDDNWMMTYYHADPAKCRAYFAEKRKRAVKAQYGPATDTYVPTKGENQ
jgi:hypothetical protein